MMAAYDLEEQEQISQLNAWWAQYGKPITALLVTGLLASSAWQGWQWYQRKSADEAAVLYTAVLKAADAGDAVKAREAAGQILQNYGSTAYAYLGALASGKVQVKSGDLKNAAGPLSWVVANAPDAAVRDIARLRLAAIQFDEGSLAEALATLGSEPVAELAPAFADLRGDILAADGKTDEARAAYRKALEGFKLSGGNIGVPMSELVEAKLETLGAAQ